MTDQTLTPQDPTQPPAPEQPAPEQAPAKPAGPSRGSIVSFDRDGRERFGVVVGTDASGDFAYVTTLPEPAAVALDDLH